MARIVSPKQRPIIIVNGRAIRYEELSAIRPLIERISADERVEYEQLPWLDYWILDTSGDEHEFNVRVENLLDPEFRRSGRQVMRLQADGYVCSRWVGRQP